MQTIHSLWKVELTHQMGYQAPYFFVETNYVVVSNKSKHVNIEREELQALDLAKKRSRLSDFPQKWTIRVIKQDRTFCHRRKKWLDRNESYSI